MQVYRSLEEISFFENTWLTLGMFDGLHRGHQEIVRQVVSSARSAAGRGLLITFDPHPLVVRGSGTPVRLLTPTQEKLQALSACDLDAVLVMPFTKQLTEIDAQVFLTDFLIRKIGLAGFITGINHAFGKNQSGTLSKLNAWSMQFGFELIEVPPLHERETMISSTRIRESIQSGDVSMANRLLGYEYTLTGTVHEGMKLGHKMGFPTANLSLFDPNKLTPGDGVYAVTVQYEDRVYGGMMNVGASPTIPEKLWEIEIYIDNFNKNIYNNTLVVQVIERIRDEIRFNALDELKTQIENDKQKTRAILANRFRRN